MLKIKLKDGSILEMEKNASIYDVAKTISDGLARVAVCGKIDGKVADLTKAISKDSDVEILTFDDTEGKKTFHHTTSHILAAAVKRLYPSALMAIGPAIDNGFYYDFDYDFDNDDLIKIENEMKKIVKENLQIERIECSKEEALKLMKDEPYKIELINELSDDEIISFYKLGDFIDLCTGPHLFNTAKVKAIKLTSVTGAYWRGDSNKKMLKRIYGTSFLKKSDLEEHLEAIENALKRDHNKIGRELEYFTTSDLVGQGLPVLLPKGARVLQLLQRFVEDTEEKLGYLLTKTPLMAKSDLYKISGHWQHYRDGMFILGDENDENVMALRPMTCPFQYQVFLNRMRSYRDLPMRLAETSTLFRNESSGEMHGLIRVRQFTISEGHIICTKEQLEDEFRDSVKLANDMLKILGLYEDVSYRFSKWDENDTEKYMGTAGQWNEAQDTMRNILNHLEIDYTEATGEAAFYGPKLDIQIKNVHGKEDTIITIQVDMLLSKSFEMEYVDTDGTKKNPYIIHRTSIGCYERTLALLLEKYAGALPLWLAPEQVRVIPITDRSLDYSHKIEELLKKAGVRTGFDSRSEKVGYKIREAQIEKVPYMVVLGDRDAEAGLISVRNRKDGETESMSIEEFLSKLQNEINSKI